MFSNDACNNYSILLTSLYRGGSEGESDESKVLYLEEWNGGKIRVQGLKWLNTYENVFMHRGERYTWVVLKVNRARWEWNFRESNVYR